MENNGKKKHHCLPCPNCPKDLLQERAKAIPFFQEGIVTYLVQVCTDCLSNLSSLDEERMAINLMAEEWPEDAARKAARAIIEEAERVAIPTESVVTERVLTTTPVVA